MNPLLDYWLKANLYLLFFFGLYSLLLHHHTFLTLNRAYLLASLGLALVLPLVHVPGLSFPWPWESPEPIYAATSAEAVEVTSFAAAPAEAPLLPEWPVLACWTFALVAAGLLLHTGWRTLSLLRLIWQWPARPVRGTALPNHTLVLPDDPQAPTFSFFRYLVLNPADARTEAVRQHELVHIRQRHSFDVLLLEIAQAFFWPNPALIGYRRAIRQVHEYIADRDAIAPSPDQRDAYARFLISYAFHVPDSATDGLVHSFGPDRPDSPTLKQRIQMLYTTHTNRRALWKYALVVPLTAALLAMTTKPEPEKAETLPLSLSKLLISVDGLVADVSTRHGLSGARVSVRNGTQHTITDASGHYRLNAPIQSVLTVAPDGYSSLEATVDVSAAKLPSRISIDYYLRPTFTHYLASLGEKLFGNEVIRNQLVAVTAATVHVSGRINDQSGKPLMGATVVVKNGTQGAQANAEGWFTLDVPGGTVLVASFVGYAPAEIAVPMKTKRLVTVTRLRRQAVDGSLMPITTSTDSQTQPAPAGSKEVFTVVESDPMFPGGASKLYQYIAANVRYPEEARRRKIQGKVFVNFIVNTDGSIDRIKILKGIGYGCNEEAVRVMSKMPNWIPGRQNGQAVSVMYNLPIEFQLDDKQGNIIIGNAEQDKRVGYSLTDSVIKKSPQIDATKPTFIYESPDTKTSKIRIQGVGIDDPDHPALYILDGIEVKRERININAIEPDEIATINVLKDASAKQVYGEKGSNGVVIIKTKNFVEAEAKKERN